MCRNPKQQFKPLTLDFASALATGVPFKATAGLHRAVRNTDPETGFEQHGFLNLLLATDSLLAGGSTQDARALLGERNGPTVSELVRALEEQRMAVARAAFTSFGTCSIAEPLTDLLELGVVADGAA